MFTSCLRELEHHHGPPGVDQHNNGKHPNRQPLFIARLLITDTPVLHESLKFILGSFHISKVIHSLVSFDSYDEDPG